VQSLYTVDVGKQGNSHSATIMIATLKK